VARDGRRGTDRGVLRGRRQGVPLELVLELELDEHELIGLGLELIVDLE